MAGRCRALDVADGHAGERQACDQRDRSANGQTYSFLNRNGGGLRPNLVGTPNTGIDPKDDRFGFLDASAYSVQPLNTPGNAPRNSAWGPRYGNLDISFVKRFRRARRRYFDFRRRGVQCVQLDAVPQSCGSVWRHELRDHQRRVRSEGHPDRAAVRLLTRDQESA